MTAAKCGYSDVVTTLLSCGANMNLQDKVSIEINVISHRFMHLHIFKDFIVSL